MNAMQALFKMCSELREEVDSLKAVVKALLESNNKKLVVVKEVVENINILSEDVNKAMDVNEAEIDRLNAEINEVRGHVKTAEVKHKTTVSKITALESSVFKPGRAFSVHHHMRPHQPPRNRYNHFRGPQPSICYNCRRPGHEARNCDKPNPRMKALNATANTLSVRIVEEEEETCP